MKGLGSGPAAWVQDEGAHIEPMGLGLMDSMESIYLVRPKAVDTNSIIVFIWK